MTDNDKSRLKAVVDVAGYTLVGAGVAVGTLLAPWWVLGGLGVAVVGAYAWDTYDKHIGDLAKKNKEYHITMLGGRGVGKTSLLATVYGEFESHIEHMDSKLALRLNHSTSLQLNDKLSELKSTIRTNFLDDYTSSGGSGDKRSYEVDMQLSSGKKSDMKLVFNDFPGSWYEEGDHQTEILESLASSTVVLWVLDTAALMAKGKGDESYDYMINKSGLLKNTLITAIDQTDEKTKKYKKLFLFIPVKCESWNNSNPCEDNKKLINEIEQIFKPFIKAIKDKDSEQKYFAVAIVPVHTLGGIQFERLERASDGKPKFIYSCKENSGYAPRYAEQILAYSLSYLSKIHREFHKKSKFTEEIDKLVKNRIEDESLGFKILHGTFEDDP